MNLSSDFLVSKFAFKWVNLHRYSLAWTAGGRLFTWGGNGKGQLGHALMDSVDAAEYACWPREVTFPPTSTPSSSTTSTPGGVKIVAAAGGGFHSVALDSRGVVGPPYKLNPSDP